MHYIVSFIVIALGLWGLSSGLEFGDHALRAAVLGPAPAGKGGMLVINATVAVQAISYTVFLVLMDKVLFQPMLVHLDSRKDIVREAVGAAEDAEKAVRQVKKQRQQQLDEAFQEASKERSRIKAAGVTEYQRIVHEARQAADASVDEARKEIDAEAEAAAKELEGRIGEFSAGIKAKLTHGEVEA